MKELKVKERLAMAVDGLGDAELGRLFRGMLQYAFSGTEPTLSGAERILWPELKEDLDRQHRGYENKVRGMAKARSQISVDICRYQQISVDISQKRETEKQEEKQKKNGSPSDSPLQEKDIREEQKEKEKTVRARKAFVPPTLDEVREYVQQRNSPVDPVQFWEYFNEGNWKDAKGQPVRAWKQKLLTWESHQPRWKKKPSQVTAKDNGTGPIDLSDLDSLLNNRKGKT